MFAAKEGKHEIVKILLGKGANIKAAADGGGTALMCASEWGHKEVVKILLSKGASIDTVNKVSYVMHIYVYLHICIYIQLIYM
jgi:ankyrin repeat protein